MKPQCDQILARFKGRSEGEIGAIGKVLGMEIMRDRSSRAMTISHKMKIKDLLDSTGMKECRTSPTPLVPKEKLKSMKVVRSIQYIACVTRPDLAFGAQHLVPGQAYVSLIQATLVGCTACYGIPAKDC